MDKFKCKPWLLLLLILVFLQCSSDNKKTKKGGLPEVTITENGILPFDEVVEEIQFIPLMQPSDTLVNLGCKLHELFISDKIFYASRCFNDLSIHSFDMAGNYLNGWNKNGEGPEAYPSLHGLTVSDRTISQATAFNSGKVLFTNGGVKLKIYGLKPNPEFSIDDMATFPFFDAFIDMNDYQVKSIPSSTGIRNKGFAHGGYFYELLHTEDWQRAKQERYFGKYQVDLSNAINNLSDKEDPILIKYKVAF